MSTLIIDRLRIQIRVDGDGQAKEWTARFSPELVEIARAAKNPAVFREVLSLLVDTAVSSCMNPDVVPDESFPPLDIL